MRLHAKNGGAIQCDLTAVRLQKAGDHGKQRGLAGAIRADQRYDFSLLDMKIDRRYRDKTAEPLRCLPHLKHRCPPGLHPPFSCRDR